MGILVLSIVAGIVVAGGIWLATCETKPAGSGTGETDENPNRF